MILVNAKTDELISFKGGRLRTRKAMTPLE
jgi:hypothetical protein